MRRPAPLAAPALAVLLFAAPLARAVDTDLVAVGNPQDCGNFTSPSGFGCVETPYQIGTFEVTNREYTAFLNAMAAVGDPFDLYNDPQRNDPPQNFSYITRTGSGTPQDPYVYAFSSGFGVLPVNFVDWADALRYVNWLENGQPTQDEDPDATESGSYDMTQLDVGMGTVPARDPAAFWVLPTPDEWSKAAFFDPSPGGPGGDGFWLYAMGTDTIRCTQAPPGLPMDANCGAPGTFPSTLGPLRVGAYLNTSNFYGTFDQTGNVSEWVESAFAGSMICPLMSGLCALEMGGAFPTAEDDPDLSAVSGGNIVSGTFAIRSRGFRVAFLPEPGAGARAAAALLALLALAGRRRRGTLSAPPGTRL